MSDHGAHERLIATLATGLEPVRPLSPVRRALGWLVVVLAIAATLAYFSDLHAMMARLGAAPDMWLAALGSTLTAVLAIVATFMTSVPGRSRGWALLPLPALALWVGESGMGCARGWAIPGVEPGPQNGDHCMMFIFALSLPLSILLMVMLRRTFPLRPNLTLALGGLAAAGAAATLLNFFHPFDASLGDLAAHAAAVAIVIVANRILGGPLFRWKPRNLRASDVEG
jgi:hypothetical protein